MDGQGKTYRLPERPAKQLPGNRPLPLRDQLAQLRQAKEALRQDAPAPKVTTAMPSSVLLDRMQAALTIFQEATKTDIPVQHLVVFLTVGRYPGHSQREYIQMLRREAKQSTISRHLTDLSIELRTRQPGYGLLAFETNVRNRRQNIYYLSPKGEMLYGRLHRTLEGGRDAYLP